MSYILDALKKSEKERTRKRTPSVASLGSDAPGSSSVSLNSILVVVLAIAVVNSAAIFVLFYEPEKETVVTTKDMTLPLNPVTKDGTLRNPPANWQLSEKSESEEVADRAAKETRPLPPIIDVTSHIYADEPHLRMVKINGMDYREGDYLDSNHRLVKITELGIVLEYYGRRYNMNVVEEWQLD